MKRSPKSRMRERVRDYVLYILITFAALGIFFKLAFLGVNWNYICAMWFGAFVFGFFIGNRRRMWRHSGFWVLLIFYLCVYFGVVSILTNRGIYLKPAWFALAAVPEVLLFGLGADLLLPVSSRGQK